MNMLEALTIACEVLEIRRLEVAAKAVTGDPQAAERAAATVRTLGDAAATLNDEREKYAPGGE